MDTKIWIILLMLAFCECAMRRSFKRCACVGLNECANPALNNCAENATCTDLPKGFSCTCNSGFLGNGTFCAEQCGEGICEVENRTCYRNQSCLCTPGFHELDGNCVENCTDFGETYIDYPGSGILCAAEFQLDFIAANLSTCQANCTNTAGCITVDVDMDTGICVTLACDPLTPGALFAFVDDMRVLSIRNCA